MEGCLVLQEQHLKDTYSKIAVSKVDHHGPRLIYDDQHLKKTVLEISV